MDYKDYYATLGVAKTASEADIKKAAEIDPAEKHAISHRADAFAKLVAGAF